MDPPLRVRALGHTAHQPHRALPPPTPVLAQAVSPLRGSTTGQGDTSPAAGMQSSSTSSSAGAWGSFLSCPRTHEARQSGGPTAQPQTPLRLALVVPTTAPSEGPCHREPTWARGCSPGARTCPRLRPSLPPLLSGGSHPLQDLVSTRGSALRGTDETRAGTAK